MKNLASEQAQHNAILVQSIQRYWTPLQTNPNPAISTGGPWQGLSSYTAQAAQQPNLHLPTTFLKPFCRNLE